MQALDEHDDPASRGRSASLQESLVIPADMSIIVTIDGPAGTGKSTVAFLLAQRLGLDVLDTGAMYRAATAIVIDQGISPDDHDRIVRVVTDADLHFDWGGDPSLPPEQRRPPVVLAWLRPMNDRIRQEDVSALVSKISTIKALREHMVRKQRLIYQQHPRLVSEGRDQGSVVFPDATIKFYLDADPVVRARRRADELALRGIIVPLDEMLRRIVERDHLDSTREDGPLVCPPDAFVINTTSLNAREVVAELVRKVRERVQRG